MGVKRPQAKIYKDASYTMFGDNEISQKKLKFIIQKAKEKKKEEVQKQLKNFKQQLEMQEEIQKMDTEIKRAQVLSSKTWNTHTRDISSPKLKNIFKDTDTKHRTFLCEVIAREERDNTKEDNFIMKIIKNIGKRKPPKNMTIVQ